MRVLKAYGQMIGGQIIDYKTIGKEEAIKRIKENLLKYEKAYFQDMTYSPGSLTGDLFNETKDCTDDEEVKSSLSIVNTEIIFEDIGKTPAIFDPYYNTITLSCFYFDYTDLLHEAIHFYCKALYEYDMRYSLRNYATVKLYEKLKNKVDNLEKLITQWLNFDRQYLLLERGSHDILFFLKAIDLEIQIDEKPGSIMGYDAPKYELIKGYAHPL